MALVCASWSAGQIRNRLNDTKPIGCSGGPSMCHTIVFRSPNLYSHAVCGMNLVWPTATRFWDHSGDVGAFKRNGEGPQRHGQWRAAHSNSSDKPTGMNGERTGNGGIRTVALTRLEEVDSNMDDDIEGKFPARGADSPGTPKLKDISTKGSLNIDAGERVTMSAESGETSSYDLSDLSAVPQSSRGGNFHENFCERDKGILEGAAEKYVSLVWETGSEIAKVAPEMASLEEWNDTEDKKFSSTVEEERHRQERLRALEGILANFPESENDLNARETQLLAFSDKLMNQSARHDEAYMSQELTEDVASRDSLLRLLQKEASVSSESFQRAVQDAERRIVHLEERVLGEEESFWEERNKVTSAVKSARSLDETARVAEDKVAELTAEISSLKALAAAGNKAEYLSAQVHALEQELKSRDSLLLEIKAETKRSLQALTVAAQIKQDLNTARQREVQLTQALEGANNMVKELQTELLQNVRSLRAEQALRQMEKMFRDVNLEVQRLRKGVEERDKSIYIMKDEVDLNIGLLNNAARDREELHKKKLQVEDLKAELASRDNKLKLLREEMASVINLARLKQSTFPGTSSSDHTSFSAAESNPAVQVSKPKKKFQSKKQTVAQRSSQSSPQCS